METRNPNAFIPTRNDLAFKRPNSVESVNRKLIRPSLTEFKDQQQQANQHKKPFKRPTPPDQTTAENFYYVKQMQARTPMVIVMADGEELHGVIEWYDRSCIKVNRPDQPNLLIYKANIKYLFKESDRDGQPQSTEPRA